jgi:hypothetical protein
MSQSLAKKVTEWATELGVVPRYEPVVTRTWLDGYLGRFITTTLGYHSAESALYRRGWKRIGHGWNSRFLHEELPGATVEMRIEDGGAVQFYLTQVPQPEHGLQPSLD